MMSEHNQSPADRTSSERSGTDESNQTLRPANDGPMKRHGDALQDGSGNRHGVRQEERGEKSHE
jgi:hypothetical protein